MNSVIYWPGPFPNATKLLAALRTAPLRLGLTPGQGRNEQLIFGELPNQEPIVLKDPLNDLLVEAGLYIHFEIIGSKSTRLFTTGVIHRNYRGLPHWDVGCVPGTPVAVLVLRDPGSLGGELRFPDLNLTLPMAHGSVAVFDGSSLKHDTSRTRGGSRYSIIFVTRKGLKK